MDAFTHAANTYGAPPVCQAVQGAGDPAGNKVDHHSGLHGAQTLVGDMGRKHDQGGRVSGVGWQGGSV